MPYARGYHPNPVERNLEAFTVNEECNVCWVVVVVYHIFCHSGHRNIIKQSSISRAIFFFFSQFSYHTHACRKMITYHVTSLGDLELGDFAGLDSGLDS